MTLLVGAGALFALLEHGWVGNAALAVALALRRPTLARSAAVYAAALAVLLSVMLTHVVFFGAGRYGLVTFPLLCALVAIGVVRSWPRRRSRPAVLPLRSGA